MKPIYARTLMLAACLTLSACAGGTKQTPNPNATLLVRCVPGHALAIAHEGPKIAAAINRYFGFVLVNAVKLSAEPFTPGSGRKAQKTNQPSQSVIAKVGAQVAEVADDDLREALRTLGHALSSRSERDG